MIYDLFECWMAPMLALIAEGVVPEVWVSTNMGEPVVLKLSDLLGTFFPRVMNLYSKGPELNSFQRNSYSLPKIELDLNVLSRKHYINLMEHFIAFYCVLSF